MKQHRVEAAGLDRVADLGRRRRRPDRPVGGDVVDLPAALASARRRASRWRCRRAAAAPGRSGRGPRRTAGTRPAGPRWTARPTGTSSGWMPKARTASAVASPTQAILTPAKCAGVEAVLGELLPHRPHRVDRGEDDPGVPAVDQALDRPLHLRRGARRLDRDGRHLDTASRRRPAAARSSRRPAPWCAARAPSSRTAAGSPTRTACPARPTAAPTVTTTRPVKPSAAGDEAVQRGRVVYWVVAGAVAGDRDRGVAVDGPAASRPSRTACRGRRRRRSATSVPGAAAAQRVEVERVHVVDVDGGARTPQRHARVAGDAGRPPARPGTTSNGTAVRATACTSLTTASCGERVAGDQPDRAQARTGPRRQQHLGHVAGLALGRAAPRRRRGRRGPTAPAPRPARRGRTSDAGRPRPARRAARRVSRPGSPGPAPTKAIAADGLAGAGHRRALPVS